jgi:hypothetical protein
MARIESALRMRLPALSANSTHAGSKGTRIVVL